MNAAFGVDLDQLRDERTYRALVPADDDFHDEELSDRWWETETCWFSWNVPERCLGGWAYCQARPNANICNGGAWVWDDRAAYPWELAYRAEYSGLRLPPRAERDMRDFEWPNGVHVRVVEPLTTYAVQYSDPGALEVDLVFEAIMEPNPHPNGVVPFLKGAHFDQAGHVSGTMVLHGEEIPVDCYSVRDRSWGPRPLGRPKPRPTARGPGRGAAAGRRGPGRSAASAIRSVPPDPVKPGSPTPSPDARWSPSPADSCSATASTGTFWPASVGSLSTRRRDGHSPSPWRRSTSSTAGSPSAAMR